jgi:hypothetical protein
MLPVVRKAPVTTSVVEAVMEPDEAWMVVQPIQMGLARPALLILATLVSLELQVTELVRFCVLPSV